MKFLAFISLAVLGGAVLGAPAAHGKAHHVVVMVWDGMRPDFVTEATTPNLWNLAKGGVFFDRQHPAYISTTEVNGTVMATGVYPEHSGLMANREYRPEANLLMPVGTELPSTVSSGGDHYLQVPTLVQMLHGAGRTTAVAGSKGVALLQDWSHNGTNDAAKESVVFFDGKSAPESAMAELTGTIGAWPAIISFPNVDQDVWTTRALTEGLWAKGVPAYSMLWMSDPDFSQHQMSPGSSMALAALKSVDERLGTVIQTLEAKGVRNDTDIFVISDHGFSTITRENDVMGQMNAAGLQVTGTFVHQPQRGEVLAVNLGGSMLFYINGHDKEVGRRLTEFVQKSDYAGVIFSRWKLPGTFDLHSVKIATGEAPDIVMAFRWSAAANKYGAPGSLEGMNVHKLGKGTHGSLSSYDMHNTLIASGPDFKQGWKDEVPTGNVDLAPTVMWILGVPHAKPMDGRVLLEAMPGHTLGRRVTQTTTHAENPETGWKEYLKVSAVGTTLYFDEGNYGAGPAN